MQTQRLKNTLFVKLFVFLLCFCLFGTAVSAIDTGDGTAFGSLPGASANNQVTTVWTYDSMDAAELKALVNSQELHPQRTGWMELDNLLQSMCDSAGGDAYSQLEYMYNWLVKNTTYSWAGYSKTTAPAYEYFTLDYLKDLTYEDGLQKAVPDDMANRTYHILTAKKGVCYDYAIAITVMARYIGLESYVRTGYFEMEYYYDGNGHHGWSILRMSGKDYVFDPQRDARNWTNNRRDRDYFGIAPENAWRYDPDRWAADTQANAERDAQMLPMTADRAHKVTVDVRAAAGGTVFGSGSYITGNQATVSATPDSDTVFAGWFDANGNLVSRDAKYTFTVKDNTVLTAKFAAQVAVTASRSGSVTGSGVWELGTEVTLNAVPGEGKEFQGWYDSYGNLLSVENTYSFPAKNNCTLYALFDGDVFCDLKADDWYLDTALKSVELGLVNGVTPVTFGGEEPINRAMAVVMLARLDGADVSAAPDSGFTDVNEGDWFYGAVNWAYANGITNGDTDTTFEPLEPVSRQDYLTMVIRYLETKGFELHLQGLTYTDAYEIADYALPMVEKAQSIGLINGYPDGSFRPLANLNRAEGVQVMLNLYNFCIN